MDSKQKRIGLALVALLTAVLAARSARPLARARLASLPDNPADYTLADFAAIMGGEVIELGGESFALGAPVDNSITAPVPSVELADPAVAVKRWQRATEYDHLFETGSKTYDLPDGLLKRVAWQESRYNPRAHNKGSDASGIMQIVPRWHPNVDPFDPQDAILYAAKYLDQLRRRYAGNWTLALAAYNWGLGNIDKHPEGASWPRETQLYVADISADVFA